jgi:16S rRNA (guanine(527)-N(7))-methyltransferase RsmG
MRTLIGRCGIDLNRKQLDQLWHYHQLLRRYDAELNLTRIHNFENMVVKLYADSILPALQTTLPSPLMDLGSGPGMPGIPLKIFRPDLQIRLAESRRPRIDFLKMALAELSLSGIEVIERGIAADYDRPVAGVITRAVEPITDTLARVAGCLERQGMVIFMKGPRCDAEIEAAADRAKDEYILTDDIPYQIPHSPHRRRLVCYRRKTDRIPVEAAARPRHRVHIIESEANAVFKDLKKLLGGRGIKKQGKALVCGARLVTDVIATQPGRCQAWITSGNRQPPPATAPQRMDWLQLAPSLFQALDVFGTRSPILHYNLPELPRWDPKAPLAAGCSVLIPFQDPENVGAVIRSAAAFRVDRIVLLAESANPFHPKAIRASAGTVFSANLRVGPTLDELPDDLPVLALAASGTPIEEAAFADRFCLLAGMEGPGLPPRWHRNAVAIPMAEGVESLNAAVATSIALYEWRRSKRAG